LDAISNQLDGFNVEIVVADNGSSDRTHAIVREYAERDPRFRLIDASERRGVSAARNAGVRAARGEFIVLCDADDEVRPGWLSAYLAVMNLGISLAGGAAERTTQSGRVLKHERGLYQDFGHLAWPIGANCGFSRAMFDRVGGFDESYRGGCDETDFFWRAQYFGEDVFAVEDAVITYFVRGDVRGIAKQQFQYGLMSAKLFREHRKHGMPRSSFLRACGAWGIGLARLVIGLADRQEFARGLTGISKRAGRLVGSLRLRVFYP